LSFLGPGKNPEQTASGEESGKAYFPRGSSHALKKGLTNLISLPLLNGILMSIIRVIARFTDAVLCSPTAFTNAIKQALLFLA